MMYEMEDDIIEKLDVRSAADRAAKTERDRRVVELCIFGNMRDKDVALMFCVTPTTVRNYRANIFKKVKSILKDDYALDRKGTTPMWRAG